MFGFMGDVMVILAFGAFRIVLDCGENFRGFEIFGLDVIEIFGFMVKKGFVIMGGGFKIMNVDLVMIDSVDVVECKL